MNARGGATARRQAPLARPRLARRARPLEPSTSNVQVRHDRMTARPRSITPPLAPPARRRPALGTPLVKPGRAVAHGLPPAAPRRRSEARPNVQIRHSCLLNWASKCRFRASVAQLSPQSTRAPVRDGMDFQGVCDGETRTRTGDTTIFSRVLYQLSYLALVGRCYRLLLGAADRRGTIASVR
jgi:hypothetical protein